MQGPGTFRPAARFSMEQSVPDHGSRNSRDLDPGCHPQAQQASSLEISSTSRASGASSTSRCSLDTQNVALRHAIVLQLLHQALHHIIQACR